MIDVLWYPIEEMTDEIRNSSAEILFRFKDELVVKYISRHHVILENWTSNNGNNFDETYVSHFAALNAPVESKFAVVVEIPPLTSKGMCNVDCPIESNCEWQVGGFAGLMGGIEPIYSCKPGPGCPRFGGEG